MLEGTSSYLVTLLVTPSNLVALLVTPWTKAKTFRHEGFPGDSSA